MLYNLRGCNGAGKTYCTTEGVLKRHERSYLVDPSLNEVVATCVPDLNLLIAGMYRDDLGTGGCDWYLAGNGGSKKTVNDLEVLLRDLVATGKKVLFEGFMISGSIGRWVALAREIPTKFLCLDTPLYACIAHIEERRQRKGNMKPFDPKNVVALHRQVLNNYEALRREGLDVVMVDYQHGPDILHEVLSE